MKHLSLPILLLLLLSACDRNDAPPAAAPSLAAAQNVSLAQARQGFQTKLTRPNSPGEPAAPPPAELFQLIRYQAPPGKLAAYLTPDPRDGKKHPAIIWITGGDSNTIGDVWEAAPPGNDQTAAAFRRAGIIMMFPSLRGGNDNPGAREGFLGEVDDVLAAAEHLARQEYVDPGRIYLGGHSTGGTLALLIAECSDRFRAVFSFGPVDEVAGYGTDFLPFDPSARRELKLRDPIRWLHSIKSPVFVFEGVNQPGNIAALMAMARATDNEKVRFYPVPGGDHFSVLAPMTKHIAGKILGDTGPQTNLGFSEQEIHGLVPR